MNCHDASALVPLYCDGELDPQQSVALEKHLHGCAACAGEREALLGLRQKIKAERSLYFAAPDALRQRALAALSGPANAVERSRALLPPATAAIKSPGRTPQPWRWLMTGALAGCAATVLAWLTAGAVLQWMDRDAVSREAVAAHVRATLAERLIVVASSDRHTVKPWLSARLDYSPPVQDFASEGFVLTGARLESLRGQPSAALVYRYRDHNIDVFVRPSGESNLEATTSAIRGFNVVHARANGMDWWCVSDVNAPTLRRLADNLLRTE